MRTLGALFRLLVVTALCILHCAVSYSQSSDGDFSVSSFRPLPTDLDARLYPKNDQNGKKAALIKVVTSEKGFSFDVGVMGVVATSQEIGEVWVYVPEGILKMTIRHKDFGVIRDYRLEIPVKSACVYEMVLHTPPKEPMKIYIPVRDSTAAAADSLSAFEGYQLKQPRIRTHTRKTLIMGVLGIVPDLSGGIMIGQHFTHIGSSMGAGWFVKGRSDFRFGSHYDYSCTSVEVWTKKDGTAHKERWTLTAGGIWHCLEWMDVYTGLGVGRKRVVWEDADGRYARISDRSYEGVATDICVVFSIGKAALSIGVTTSGKGYLDLEAGVGIAF